MSILIEVQDITRRYGDRCAVEGLTFRLEAGEVLGLLGVNGAGKSTTLNMLAGCLPPSAGTLRIAGHDMARAPVAARAALGYLPEVPPLYSEMRVEGYLRYAARLRRVPAAACASAVERAMTLCGLVDAGGRLIAHLSKGYRQRVGIAQAIVHEPAVVILDEPTAGLDPVQIREIRALISQLGEHCSVILSSHILPEVQSLCDRVLILHRGRALFQGPPQGSPKSGASVEVAFDRPPAATALEGEEGVAQVESLGDGRFRLVPIGDQPLPDLLGRLARQPWGLREFSPLEDDLEQVFLEIVAGEAA